MRSERKIKIEEKYKNTIEQDGEYKYIRAYFKGDMLPSGKVINSRNTYVEIKHKYCGHIYTVKYGSFYNSGDRCPNCCKRYENSFAHHIEVELGEPLEKYWDFEKNVVNPCHIYKNHNGKVWIKCQDKDYHGSYEVSCNKFTKNTRCTYCSSRKVHRKDSFGQWLVDRNLFHLWSDKNTIDPFNLAKSTSRKVLMLCENFICEKCGHEWKSIINNIARLDQWCPKCSMSKGEKRILEYLEKNKIYNIQEKTFDGLNSKNNAPLRYDFYLPDFNMIIEYDGLQHDKWIKSWMSKKEFDTLQYHDKLKNDYADKNNIRLLRIKEKDFDNIENILEKELNL